MTEPVVSVVVAVYNGEVFIEETFKSILGQTYTNWECIIVDDGSTDSTVEIIERYLQSDARFRLIKTKGGNGSYVSANLAFPYCRGKYIARTDADDISLPTRFEKQVKIFDERPEINICSSNYFTFGPGTKTTYRTVLNDNLFLNWQLMFQCRLVHSTMMLRKSWFEEMNWYPPLKLSQDYNTWCVATRSGSLYLIEEGLVMWRHHPNSITTTKKEEQFEQSYLVAFNHAQQVLTLEINAQLFKVLYGVAWNKILPLNIKIISALEYLELLFDKYCQNKKVGSKDFKRIKKEFNRIKSNLLKINLKTRKYETISYLLPGIKKGNLPFLFSMNFIKIMYKMIFK